MTERVGAGLGARAFAAVGVAATIISAIGAIALRTVDPVPVLPSGFGFTDLALVGFGLMGSAFAVTGALIVVRQPGNIIGWSMVVIGLGYAGGVLAAAITYSLAVIETPEAALLTRYAGWATSLLTTLGGIVFFIGFVFPTGRGRTLGWDRFIRAMWSLLLVGFALIVFEPGPINVFPTIENPLGIAPDLRPVLGIQFSTFAAASSVGLVPALAWSLLSRYSHAGHVERQQLKWFGLSIVLAIAGVAIAGLGAMVSERAPEIGLASFGFVGTFVPVAIGIAILRHGLYDIDRLVSRTIAYGLLTAMLFGIFFLVNVTVQAVVGPAFDDAPIVVALSTLLVATMVAPLRRRVQGVVDRRFDRTRYDADQTVGTFAGRLRGNVDLPTVSAEIVDTANAAVRPTTTGVWIRGTGR
jgi:hypothetical protein